MREMLSKDLLYSVIRTTFLKKETKEYLSQHVRNPEDFSPLSFFFPFWVSGLKDSFSFMVLKVIFYSLIHFILFKLKCFWEAIW